MQQTNIQDSTPAQDSRFCAELTGWPPTDRASTDTDLGRLNIALLGIAVDEAVKDQPPRATRSQLARRDYVPEAPVVLPAPKKSRLKELLRLFRPAALIAIVALVLFGSKASNDWFDAHFAYGVEKTSAGPAPAADDTQAFPWSHDPAVALVQKQEFLSLPKLPILWHWAMIPFSLSRDSQGHPSFWVAVRLRGVIRSQDDLPKTGEIGDEYFSADGTMAWVWMLPTGAQVPSWVDP